MGNLINTEYMKIVPLVEYILNQGHCISVYDEEEIAQKRTDNKSLILNHIGDTEETILQIWSNEDCKKRLGQIILIHGNGADVISDYCEAVEHLVKGAGIGY